MAIEKIEPLGHPRIETRLQVTRDLLYDVLLLAQPHQLGARRRRPDRVFTLFTEVTVLHANPLLCKKIKGPAEAEPFFLAERFRR